jgi:hypothetical protein
MDFVEQFFDYTDGLPTPEIFRRWAGIAAIGGALERRVWMQTGGGLEIYPNLFILFLAHPGVGKSQAIDVTRNIWTASKTLFVAPDSLTKAAFLDRLSKCSRTIIRDGKLVSEFHSMQIAADEFGNLVPTHDTTFLNVLNTVYNNPVGSFSEERRTGTVKELSIYRPSISILAGTQPGFLDTLLPEQAWSMGYMSRTIMIWSKHGPDVDLFAEVDLEKKKEKFKALVDRMKTIINIYGQVSLSKDVKELINEWKAKKYAPVPEHSKLQHYIPRRVLHILKLAIIAAVSRNNSLIIEGKDFLRAKLWLLDAESRMTDVFKEMGAQTHMEVIKDLLFILNRQYAVEKKPFSAEAVYGYLGKKIPSDKIQGVLDLAIRSGMIEQITGTNLFIPKGARNEL